MIKYTIRNETTVRAIQPAAPFSEVEKLERAYQSAKHELKIATDSSIQDSVPIDQSILSRRVHSYVYASLHRKGKSINYIMQQQAVSDKKNANNQQVSHMLWAGRKWKEIFDLYSSIVKELNLGGKGFRSESIICLLKFEYPWFRAKHVIRQTALTNLCLKTNILTQSENFGDFIEKIIKDTQAQLAFQRDPCHTLEPLNTKQLGFDTTDDTRSWKAVSETIVAQACPGLMGPDASLLLILLCFFNPDVSLTVLSRGASPRKRWTRQGEIEEIGPHHIGLMTDLQQLLSDVIRLDNAAYDLEKHSAISRNLDGTYTVDPATRGHILDQLPRQFHTFWRLQALIVSYRSVPWKYLEPLPPNLGEIIVPHLKYTLQAVRDYDGFESMSENMKVDLALSLVEASRFKKIEWKQFAIARAKEAVYELKDKYIHCCIASRESLLYRITGDYTQAVNVINTISGRTLHQSDEDMMLHIALGHLCIQRAMNYFQNEQLAMAMNTLVAWQPMHNTPAETTILFQMSTLRGKIFRFQGKFSESLACLKSYMVEDLEGLFFGEELSNLICEIADTLRELDEPVHAEQLLRRQLAHEEQAQSSAELLLKLSLAESLFAQEKFVEAEMVCSDIKSRSLSKIGKLRLCITLAKLRHIQCDWDSAFDCWTEALIAMNKFPPTSGLATRTIYLSICDILRCQGLQELELTSRKEVATLERVSEHSEARHWIPGFRHWLIFLKSRDIP